MPSNRAPDLGCTCTDRCLGDVIISDTCEPGEDDLKEKPTCPYVNAGRLPFAPSDAAFLEELSVLSVHLVGIDPSAEVMSPCPINVKFAPRH